MPEADVEVIELDPFSTRELHGGSTGCGSRTGPASERWRCSGAARMPSRARGESRRIQRRLPTPFVIAETSRPDTQGANPGPPSGNPPGSPGSTPRGVRRPVRPPTPARAVRTRPDRRARGRPLSAESSRSPPRNAGHARASAEPGTRHAKTAAERRTESAAKLVDGCRRAHRGSEHVEDVRVDAEVRAQAETCRNRVNPAISARNGNSPRLRFRRSGAVSESRLSESNRRPNQDERPCHEGTRWAAIGVLTCANSTRVVLNLSRYFPRGRIERWE
jgi:hypothetical protein